MSYSGYLSGYSADAAPPPPAPTPAPAPAPIPAPAPAPVPIPVPVRPAAQPVFVSAWQVLARDADRNILGPLTGFALSLTIRFNEVGSWTITIPPERCPPGWPAPACGAVFVQDGVIQASGELDQEDFEQTSDGDLAAGMWTLTGDTDLARIAYRFVYPDPAQYWLNQNTVLQYQRPRAVYNESGLGELMLRSLFTDTAGPAALPERQSGVTLGPYQGVGTQTQVAERFTPLLDAMRATALSGGGLGFDVVTSADGTLQYVVYQTRDLSGTARFSFGLGNLLSLKAVRTAPTATVALVAGSQVGTAREKYQAFNANGVAVWDRREVFLDQRQQQDTPESNQIQYATAAADALTQGAGQVSVQAEIIDTPQVRLFRDLNLGDTVSVDTVYGLVTDLVRAVQVDVSESGDSTATAVVGTVQATSGNGTVRMVAALQRRISQLERAL